MVEESIVFSGEVSDRSLDQSAQKVEERFSEAGQIQVDAATDGLGMDGFADGGGMGLGGDGGGTGPLEVAGISSLASKIPKPIAGVSMGAVLPVALGGAVGAGMLSAMHGASARLQTSNSILGQAWNNIWRPIGDKVDQLFIRPVALDILRSTEKFEETLRSGDWVSAFGELSFNITGAIAPGDFTVDFPSIGELLRGDISGLSVSLSIPKNLMPDIPEFHWPDLPDFNWPQLPNFDWPSVGTPDWPSADELLSGFPSISTDDLLAELTGGGGETTTTTAPDDHGFQGPIMPPSDTGGGGLFSDFPFVGGMPTLQRGGRVERSGVARVHRGEMVADPDRLVSELAGAIRQAGGGGGGEVDMGSVESKLDDVNRNLKRLSESMSDLVIEADGETLGRVAQQGKQDRLADTNPLV